MSEARDTLLGLTLLALVFTGPAAVAAYLLSGERAEVPMMLAAAGTSGSAAANEAPNPGRTPSAASVIAGVLYTSGTAQVDWNGEKIPVADGSYAYLGGEQTPVKKWLLIYLWTNLMHNCGGLLWRNRHQDLLDRVRQRGISVREWIDAELARRRGA